jgi:hypothetical protein
MLWRQLAEQAEALRLYIPAEAQDAYYQLVYYPAVASACVAEIYNAVTQNHYYAERGDVRANAFADRAKELFTKDSLLTEYYNHQMAGGKWNGMMRDKHIGYQQWFMPEKNQLPCLRYVPQRDARPSTPLPETTTEEYSIEAIHYNRCTPANGISWQLLPDLGRGEGCMGINPVTAESDETGNGPKLEYQININKEGLTKIAIGILPTQDVQPERGLRLGVKMDNGEVRIIDARRGLVDTFDEYTPQNLKRSKKLKPLPERGKMALNGYKRERRNEVFDNMRWLDVSFEIRTAGIHTLSLIMIDPEIVVERLVINPDDNHYSYFGPPENKP